MFTILVIEVVVKTVKIQLNTRVLKKKKKGGGVSAAIAKSLTDELHILNPRQDVRMHRDKQCRLRFKSCIRK